MAEAETAAQPAPRLAAAPLPVVSLVVPVFNEEGTLEEVCRRSTRDARELGKPFELIVVDDGSLRRDVGDRRAARRRRRPRPGRAASSGTSASTRPCTRASSRARGDIVVTMDADLQNVPEDLPKLIAAVEGGVDVASGRRRGRDDSWGRTLPSKMVNGMLRRFTGVDDRRLRLRLQRVLALGDRAGDRRHRQAEVHEGARPLRRRQRGRGRPLAPGPRGRLALLALPADPAGAARARGLLAAADPVGRRSHRRDLRAAHARRRRVGDRRLDRQRRLPGPPLPRRPRARRPRRAGVHPRACRASTWGGFSATSRDGPSTRSTQELWREPSAP